MAQALERALEGSHLDDRQKAEQFVHFVNNRDKTALTRKIQEEREQERHVMAKLEHVQRDEHLKQKLTKRLRDIHEDVLIEEEHIRTIQRIILAAMHQSAAALGAGTFGDVRKAELPIDRDAPYQCVAVKTMRLPPCSSEKEIDDEIKKIQREMQVQAFLSDHTKPHPNITPILFDHEWQIGKDRQNTFFALVMPCASGTLDELIPTIQSITDVHARHRYALSLMSDIVDGLTYMHSQGLIHCDIKPKNFLVFKDGDKQTVKLTDFGFASTKDDPMCLQGSPNFLAPELFDYGAVSPLTGKRTWTAQQDWFSIGITLCEMLGIKEAALQLPVRFDRPLTHRDYKACLESYKPWHAQLLSSFLAHNNQSKDRYVKGLLPWQSCILDLLEVDPADRSAAHLKIACQERSFSSPAVASASAQAPQQHAHHHHHSDAAAGDHGQSLPPIKQRHTDGPAGVVQYNQWPGYGHAPYAVSSTA